MATDRNMRRKIRRSVSIAIKFASFASFIFSAVCTFLGAAPSGVIKAVLGPALLGYLRHVREGVLNMTSEQARWFLVFQGDLFFGVSLYLLFYVYLANKLAKMYVTQGELMDMTNRLKVQLADGRDEMDERIAAQKLRMDSILKEANEKLAQARRSERTARNIHGSTYKMLQKIRDERTSDN